jgi:hypothetical protein
MIRISDGRASRSSLPILAAFFMLAKTYANFVLFSVSMRFELDRPPYGSSRYT